MFCCSFVFSPGSYDEDFHRLNNAIDVYAKNLEGFSHNKSWYSEDNKTVNAMYYFHNIEAVEKLANLPAHLKAKEQVDRWYIDYKVEIFRIEKSYGKTVNSLN